MITIHFNPLQITIKLKSQVNKKFINALLKAMYRTCIDTEISNGYRYFHKVSNGY